MINRNPYSNYKEQSLSTMTQGEMLKTLYDGLLKQIVQSKYAFEKNNLEEVNLKLQKSQLILKHLRNTLDFTYDISKNLDSLYEYCSHLLIEANIKKETAHLDEVIKIITSLRDAYVQADKNLRLSENNK